MPDQEAIEVALADLSDVSEGEPSIGAEEGLEQPEQSEEGAANEQQAQAVVCSRDKVVGQKLSSPPISQEGRGKRGSNFFWCCTCFLLLILVLAASSASSTNLLLAVQHACLDPAS